MYEVGVTSGTFYRHKNMNKQGNSSVVNNLLYDRITRCEDTKIISQRPADA